MVFRLSLNFKILLVLLAALMMPAKSVSLAYAYKVGIRHAKGKRGNDKVGRRRRRGSTFKDWIVEHPFKVTIGSVGSIGGVLLAKKIIDHLCEKNKVESVGSVGGVLFAKKIVDHLCEKNKVESNGEIKFDGKVKLSKVDEEFIKRNFFLCAWENNSCWNDVFVQFFMCPDVRRGKYNSKAIMTTIDFINSVLGQEYNGDCLCRKVKCPINKRPIFKYFDEIKQEWHYADYYLRNSMFNYCTLFESFFDNQVTTDLGLFGTISSLDDNWDIPEDFSENTIRREDWFEDWEIDLSKTKERLGYSIRFKKIEKWNSSNIFFENVGYYPIFIRIFISNHFVSYYIIYNENKEVKYFLLADGMKKNMVVLSKEQALEQIGVSKSVDIVYTKSDIVEKYYIP